MKTANKILIPDPINLVQTAALRALGRRGDICDVAWSRGKARGKLNGRYCRKVVSLADSQENPELFAKAVVEQCRNGTYDVVLPTKIGSLKALLPYASQLAECTATLMPSREQFDIGQDKMRTVSWCRELGITQPDAVYLTDDSNLDKIAEELGYPLVIKHRKNFGGSKGVRIVAEQSQLAIAMQELLRLSNNIEDLLVQKFLPGALFDACMVARDGVVAGMVTQTRKLMYPISGGTGCTLVTVDIPELTETALHIVNLLNWNGPVQLEFKWDADKEAFSLIEINPRFWGTTGAWLRAGANFPALAVDLALGREVGDFPVMPPNLRFKYFLGRSPYALIQLWRAKGFSALFDAETYEQTWYDVDLTDPLPDLWRLGYELKALIRGKRMLVDKGLPAEFIP